MRLSKISKNDVFKVPTSELIFQLKGQRSTLYKAKLFKKKDKELLANQVFLACSRTFYLS